MALETQISAKIVTVVDQASLDKSIASVEKKMSEVTGVKVKVDVDTNASQVKQQVQELEAVIMKNKKGVQIDYTFDENALRSKLNSSLEGVKMFARDTKVELDKARYVDIQVDVAKANAKLMTLRQEMKNTTDGQRLAELKIDTNKAQSQLTEMQRKLQNLRNTGDESMSRLNAKFLKLGDTIQNSIGKLGQSIGGMLGGGGQVQSSVEGVGNAIGGLAMRAGPVGAIFGGIAVAAGGVGGAMVSLADKLEQTKTSFTVMLGSAELAEQTLQDLSKFASKTPFTISGIRENATQLLAYGLEAKDLIPTLTTLGNASLGNSEKFNRLAYAYGQVKAAGKLMGGELRQITETGLPILDELAKLTGKSTKDLAGNIAEANISFDTFNQALTNIAGKEGGKFFGLMGEQSKTLTGILSNLSDNFTIVAERIGTALLPAIKTVASFMQGLSENLKNGTGAMTGFGVALTAVGVGIALLTGPIGIVAGAIVGLTGAILTFQGAFGSTTPAINEFALLTQSVDANTAKLNEQITKLNDQMKTLEDSYYSGAISVEEYATQQAKLLMEKDELQAKIEQEQDRLEGLKDGYNNVSETIEENKKRVKELADNMADLEKMYKNNEITQSDYEMGKRNLSKAMDEESNKIKEGEVALQGIKEKMIGATSSVVLMEKVNKALSESQNLVNGSMNDLNTAQSQKEFDDLKAKKIEQINANRLLIKSELETMKVYSASGKITQAEFDKAQQAANAASIQLGTLMAQVKSAKFTPPKATDTTKKSSGGGGGGGGSKKTPAEIAEQEAKDEQDAIKKANDEKIKLIEDNRERELKSLEKKKDKAQKKGDTKEAEKITNEMIAIADKAEQKINDINGKGFKNILERIKAEKEAQEKKAKDLAEIKKEEKDIEADHIKDVTKIQEEGTKNIEKYKEEVAKIGEKYIEASNTAKGAIDDINRSLAGIGTEQSGDLASRFAKVQEDIKGLSEKKDKTAEDTARLVLLEKEKVLITANTTEEQRKEAIRKEGLSEAEKIIEKYAEQKKQLEEQKAVQEAIVKLFEKQDSLVSKVNDQGFTDVFTKDQSGNLTQIQDNKAREAALGALEKKTGLDKELADKQAQIDAEMVLTEKKIADELALYNSQKDTLKANAEDLAKYRIAQDALATADAIKNADSVKKARADAIAYAESARSQLALSAGLNAGNSTTTNTTNNNVSKPTTITNNYNISSDVQAKNYLSKTPAQ